MSDFLRRDDEGFDDLFGFADEDAEEEEVPSGTKGKGRGFGSIFAKIRARRKAHEGGKRGRSPAEADPASTGGASLDLEGDLWLESPRRKAWPSAGGGEAGRSSRRPPPSRRRKRVQAGQAARQSPGLGQLTKGQRGGPHVGRNRRSY